MYLGVSPVISMVLALLGAGSFAFSDPLPSSAPPASQPTEKPNAASTSRSVFIPRAGLYGARSQDGLKFETSPRILLASADAPTLARLPDGRLLLVFEQVSAERPEESTGLGLVVSTDEGRTWSRPQAIEVRGLEKDCGMPRRPAVVVRPDGEVWLYFLCSGRRATGVVFVAEIHGLRDSPVTSQPVRSVSGKLLGRAELVPSVGVSDLVVARIDKDYHLVGTQSEGGAQRWQGISADGRRFKILGSLPVRTVGTDGAIGSAPLGYRLYGAAPGGVISSSSRDGRTWMREAGTRISRGAGMAIIRLNDKSWLAVYARSQTGPGRKARPAREETGSGSDPESGSDDGAAEEEQGASEPSGSGGAEGVEPEVIPPPPDEKDTDLEGGQERFQDEGFQNFEYTDLGVPVPDFIHRIDCVAWLRAEYDPNSVPDNAWDDYAALLFDPEKGPRYEYGLPDFSGMLNSSSFQGLPAPWNPAEHPDWEEAYQQAKPYLARFAEATTHANFARPWLLYKDRPVDTEENQTAAPPDDDSDRLLVGLFFPDLSAYRSLVKQTLSDAWRAPNGKPDPLAMAGAFGVCLDNAEHVGRNSFTLIEAFVSHSLRSLVEQNARCALLQEVFTTPEQLEGTFNLLRDRDLPMPAAGGWLRGEQAFSLDITQYLFGVGEEGDGQQLKIDRLKNFIGVLYDNDGSILSAGSEEVSSLTPQRVTQNFLDYYTRGADMLRRGYPEVKAKDPQEMAKPYMQNNCIAQIFLPPLSPIYVTATRQEASRRATQLSYAIHIYKSRHGRLPQSLDELPVQHAAGIRQDPFSGRDFVYRVTGDKFKLYSVDENGVDDGGERRPSGGQQDKESADQRDDFVYWPPQ